MRRPHRLSRDQQDREAEREAGFQDRVGDVLGLDEQPITPEVLAELADFERKLLLTNAYGKTCELLDAFADARQIVMQAINDDYQENSYASGSLIRALGAVQQYFVSEIARVLR